MPKKKAHSWQDVAKVEYELNFLCGNSCDRWMAVGSFRRKMPTCHDLDIVVIPRYELTEKDLFGGTEQISLFDRCLEEHGFVLDISGEAKKMTEYRGVPVDFYIADEHNFTMVAFIRTGSEQNNIRLASLAKRRGMKLAYRDGCIRQPDGSEIHITSERQIYEVLGEPWQEPEGR